MQLTYRLVYVFFIAQLLRVNSNLKNAPNESNKIHL